MALDQATEHHQLPCGRDVEQVRRDLDVGRWDDHEQHCGHCTAAAASLRALTDAVSELRADPTEPTPRLLDKIMTAVRVDADRQNLLALGSAPSVGHVRDQPAGSGELNSPMGRGAPVDSSAGVLGGQARIAVSAVAAVLRYSADLVEGVRARRAVIIPTGTDPDGRVQVHIELGVSLLYRTGPVPDLLAELRWRLAAAAEAQAGLTVDTVDVEIEDVYLPES